LPYQHYQNLQPTSHLKLEFNTKTLPTPILVAVHFLSKPIKNSIHHYSPWTSFFVFFFFFFFAGLVEACEEHMLYGNMWFSYATIAPVCTNIF
jgi:hypothetical protein